jgi:hypothetical protein
MKDGLVFIRLREQRFRPLLGACTKQLLGWISPAVRVVGLRDLDAPQPQRDIPDPEVSPVFALG